MKRSPGQKLRDRNIIKKSDPIWKKIALFQDLKSNSDEEIAVYAKAEIAMLQVFARDQIINLRQSVNCSQLGFFTSTNEKWKLLNLIFYYSTKGESFYKAKCMKYLRMSARNFDAIIKEAIARGSFIYLSPYGAKLNSKIRNIRPSEKLIIEYIRYNVQRCQRGLKNFKRYGIK
tara:strand:- start:33 stop:554 length:522 start_codon:yes stop_codon:yes gene_type:complete